jgi:hypothetical protein
VSTNLGGAIYGTIGVGALLAGETALRETYAETIGAAALTLVLYWLAHAYAASAAARLREEEHLTLKGFATELVREVSILGGAAVPLLALVIFGLAGAMLATAVNAAIWTSAAVIAAIETFAGVRAGAKGRELAAQVAVGIGLGLLVIAIKVVLH